MWSWEFWTCKVDHPWGISGLCRGERKTRGLAVEDLGLTLETSVELGGGLLPASKVDWGFRVAGDMAAENFRF
ncbi:hypothetical protein SLEP1_g12509 [Rubroshorea leprosula]|uniref:Uncharacterized protein n=1 Tax=Rubroshorea leprosula TaxID=152421 RepID=A0AAV5ICR9_9ROSI|nr:hypothetical protein SLEP1_g12509 [Rubroshorea leprosula]